VEKSSSKIIPSAEQEDVHQWEPPRMARGPEDVSGFGGGGSLLTAEQLEQVQNQAYQEGFDRGQKEGFQYGHKEALEQGRVEIQESVEQMDQLMTTLETPLKQLDDQVEREIVSLIISMVRQLVRREVKTDPGQVIGVVRETLAVLPVSARNVRLVLHPEDAKLVREIYDVSENEVGWVIAEDPVLERGGCKVITDTSHIDATLESRLASMITSLLGGERDVDDSEPEAPE